MYYLAKILQAAAMTIITVDFIRKFPELMNPRLLLFGIILFFAGWVIERYLLKKV